MAGSSRTGTINFHMAIKNTGTAPATNLRVMKAILQGSQATAGVGATRATLAAGDTWYVDISFPTTAGASGATRALNLVVKYTQGSYGGGMRVRVP